jgi:hypothetical protein
MKSDYRIGRQLQQSRQLLNFVNIELAFFHFFACSELACWNPCAKFVVVSDCFKKVLCVNDILNSLEFVSRVLHLHLEARLVTQEEVVDEVVNTGCNSTSLIRLQDKYL